MAIHSSPASGTHRIEGPPEEVAARLGPGARCLFLLGASRGSDVAGLALDLARSVGERRHRVLLLGLADDAGGLDRLVGLEAPPGLTAAFRGEAGIVDVAVRDEGRSFFYFPAGAASPEALLSSRVLSRLLRRARSEDSTVLLYVDAEPLLLESLRAEVDGSILLGDRTGRAAPASVPVLARVRAPSADIPSEGKAAGSGRTARRVRGRAPSPPGGSQPARRGSASPEGPGLVGFSPRSTLTSEVRSRWREIVLIFGVAVLLGVLVAWEGAYDLLQRWMTWSAEVKGQAW